MSETVYLVVSGEYSDYEVSCAFTDEARATAFCSEQNSVPGMAEEGYRVERIDLNPPLPSEVKAVTTDGSKAGEAEPRGLDDDALSDAIAQVLTCYDDQDVFSPAIRDEMHSRVFHAVRAVLRGADPRAALLADLEALVRRWNMQAGTLASSPFEQCADELAAEVKKHREVD